MEKQINNTVSDGKKFGARDEYNDPTIAFLREYGAESILENLTVDGLLGKGGSGNVYSVHEKFDASKCYALKVVEIKGDTEDVMNEIDALRCISHDNAVRLYKYCIIKIKNSDASYLLILMEALQKIEKSMPESQVRLMLTDICSLLNACHNTIPKIVHRDIKPSNILKLGSGEDTVYKLSDFGVAKLLPDMETTGMVISGIGTRGFLPPEFFPEYKYGKPGQLHRASDIFSLGVTAYYLLSGGKIPFYTGWYYSDREADRLEITTAEHTRNSGKPLPDIVGVSAEMMNLIRRMCAIDYHKRPKAAEVLSAVKAMRPIDGKKQGGARKILIAVGSAAAAVIIIVGAVLAIPEIYKPSENPPEEVLSYDVSQTEATIPNGPEQWEIDYADIIKSVGKEETQKALTDGVPFDDPYVEEWLRHKFNLNKPNGKITLFDACSRSSVVIGDWTTTISNNDNERNMNISLDALRYFVRVQKIEIIKDDLSEDDYKKKEKGHIADLTPITSLKELRSVLIFGYNMTDLSPFASLPHLIRLELFADDIEDISPLSRLENLIFLDLEWNNISDLSPLKSQTKLTYLSIVGNEITDISALASLTNLSTLDLQHNSISDISPLLNLTNLKELHLEGNRLSAASEKQLRNALPDCNISL